MKEDYGTAAQLPGQRTSKVIQLAVTCM